MPVTFKLNGSPLVAPGNPGLGSPVLSFNNQQADTLTLTHHGRTLTFDAAPLFDFNAPVVLTRVATGSAPVPVFVGTIQEIPRRLGLEETINYVAHGPWQWLSTFHYLQTFALASNPADLTPTLVTTYLGRVVMGQAPTGSRENLGAALADIVNWAIGSGCPILLGSITGFDFQVPFDQATDLTCDQAITRLLQSWAPDAVVWWDYTTKTGDAYTPAINIGRRANLTVQTLAVAPMGAAGIDSAYVPFESIDLVPLYARQCTAVVLLYPKTNTSGSDTYVTLDVDKWPSTATGREARAIVRTIQLAGYSSSQLSQAVKTRPLVAALGAGSTDPDPSIIRADFGGSPGDFDALCAFWKRKIPVLAAAGVVIKGFKNRRRSAAPAADATGAFTTPTLDTSLPNELVAGGITPWMEFGTLNRKGQEQTYECCIAYSIGGVDQADADGFGIPHSCGVMATNCTTQTYTQENTSSVGDDTPVGLAQAVFAAESILHHDGQLVVIEREASLAIRVGHVVNLSGSLADWASMLGLVQAVTVDLDQARTTLKVGPPAQLGADSLAALYRVNRFRAPVTAAGSRATGLA